MDALDYLVKPFPYDRFLKAVNKATEKISHVQSKSSATNGFILLKSDKKVYKVNYNDIYYLQSLGDYVKVFTSEKCLVVHDTFKNMLEQLPANEFMRIHKSYLIALSKIQYIDCNQVKIANELIPIAVGSKDELIKRLKEV